MLHCTRRLIAVFIMFSLFSQPIFATPTASDYGALPVTQMVAISPNGNLIANRYVTSDQDVLIVNSLSEKKLLAVFDISKVQPQTVQFINDNQLFIVASEFTRVEGFRGKFDLSTAYLLDVANKKIRQLLIPGDKILAGQTGLGRVLGVSADGQYLLMPAYANPDTVVREPPLTLYKVDLNKRVLKESLVAGNKTKDFFVDRVGDPIAREDFDDRANLHTIKAKVNNKWIDIFSEKTSIRSKNFVGVSPDFLSLVFLERDEKTHRTTYNLMKLADGTITRSLVGREDADIDGTISDTQRVVYGVRYSGFSPTYQFFDPAIDQRVKDILAQFPEHSVYLSDWTPDWKNIVINVQGSNYASEYFLSKPGQSPIFLMSGYPQIKSEDLNVLGKVKFTARDGLKIPTLLTIPRAKAAELKNLPAVIYPHGGPESHDQIAFDYFAQALASQGYLVVQPQFRGSSGFGAAFRDAGLGEWGKKMQDDVTDAVKFLTDKGIIDPKRVCIVGASYGGYAALAGGAFTPELYKCVVSINGIGSLNDMLSYDHGQGREFSESAAYWEMQLANENGDVKSKELEKVSPEYFAKNFTASVLLIGSANDQIVSPEQTNNMYAVLKRHHKSVQKVVLEGDDHHLEKGPTRTRAVEEVVKFVKQELQ